MKLYITGLFLTTALSAAAFADPILVSGRLDANAQDLATPTSESREYSGFELTTQDAHGSLIVYSVLVGGNTCGHAIAIGKLMRAPQDRDISMNLEVVEGSLKEDGIGIARLEAYAYELPDDNLFDAGK